MSDPYTDPAGGCLHNRLGITDPAVLARVEVERAYVREVILYLERPNLGRFDLDHLRAVHRWLFGDVYTWAGELRTVNLTKGATGLRSRREHVDAEARRIFARLATDRWLRDLDRDRFCVGAGRLLADLNALHPFREGNGRAQRAFLQLLANQAGWRLGWADVHPAENESVSRAAMADPDAFTPLLRRIVRPPGAGVPVDDLVLERPDQPHGSSPDL